MLHIHDNDGSKEVHLIPFKQVNLSNGNGLVVGLEDVLKGLKKIGDEGPLTFKIFIGITVIPPEMRKATLQYICEVGNYMRDYITK